MGSHRVRHNWIALACIHALEKEMATHSSILAWRVPGTEEPGGLPSMGLHRVWHDWSDLQQQQQQQSASFCGYTIFYSVDHNPVLYLFTLLLKLFQLWPLGTPLGWLTYPFVVPHHCGVMLLVGLCCWFEYFIIFFISFFKDYVFRDRKSVV